MAAEEAHEDVFLLYNEREEHAPEAVVDALRERGITVYFFRTDFPVGSEIASGEDAKLDAARAVVVLLGQNGWGPTQRDIAYRAESLQKPIIPALIADPPEIAFEEVDGMFRRRLRIDLRRPTPDLYDRLALTVRQVLDARPPDMAERPGPRFDEIIRTLTDGSDVDRSALLQRIRRDGVADRAGLAARLRGRIEGDFSPGQESQFATAIRDPKRLTSIRSWMLSVLIWLEPFSDESRDLILRHLEETYETDRAVRFWVLAGAIQARLPYLIDAIGKARDDPAPEVSGLASIAPDPANDSILQRFREALGSERFETTWYVLRILRIFPIPALAGDVVAQLERSAEDKTLTYDALFALANPEMASAARPIVLDRLGLRRFVQLIIRESRGATRISTTAFARVLSVFDRQQALSALQEAAADPEDRLIVRNILDDIAAVIAEPESEPPIPGYASEKIEISKDDIGIGRDVRTLASVMLARDVPPPLAIGLFGEWGSGKSFYIKSIEAAVEAIATRARSQRRRQFCSRVVQINFNAWHYVDTSLWASLVSHMLDGLSAHLAPRQTPAEQRAALARDLASAKAEMELAKAEQVLAATQLEKTTTDLQKKILERERSEVRLRDLRAADLLALLNSPSQKKLNETLRSALADVGAPAALESIAELNKVVEESYSTGGRALALLVSLFKGRNIWIGLAGIILFFAAPPLIILVVQEALNEYAAQISALIAKATVAIGSVTLILSQALKMAKSGLDALSEAKRKIDEQLAAKRLTPSDAENKLQEAVSEARASEKAAAERVAAATARAQEIEGRVATLEDSQSLGYFIAERSRSEDYRRHLGLISMIRKDFDGLMDRVHAQTGENGIDRIILYIDDVDRCPPQMVVDILQAVHLLLAYELFVVVVSVDPRWLLRSLESRMTQLQTGGSTAVEGMTATPQDYLEKIFQIPFSVRPMGQQGFARLMERLLPPSDSQPAAARPQPAQPQPEQPQTGGESPAQPRPSPGPASAPEPSAPMELDALAEVLEISRAESEFAQTLHMLVPTPRGAKRFANIYRLLKASQPRGELAAFQGTERVPGDFQLPMLLLALLVGQPALAGGLFPQLLSRAREGQEDWWPSGWAANAITAEEVRLREQLDELVDASYFPRSPALVVRWLPQVARYSFTTARMFLEER